jgi:hypothetical protein
MSRRNSDSDRRCVACTTDGNGKYDRTFKALFYRALRIPRRAMTTVAVRTKLSGWYLFQLNAMLTRPGGRAE